MTLYGRSEELVSRCVECDLAEPESLTSLGGSAPGVVDGILSLGPDDQMTGKYDTNPYHNSVLYEVKFDNGQVCEYSANVITENMLAQVDSDGFTLRLMDGIVYHKVDCALAVSKTDKWVYNRHGWRCLHKTTAGGWLLVRWKDENETWMKLLDMKESYPIEMAEYAISRGIDNEPAFDWWVVPTLKRRKAIVAALKTRM